MGMMQKYLCMLNLSMTFKVYIRFERKTLKYVHDECLSINWKQIC